MTPTQRRIILPIIALILLLTVWQLACWALKIPVYLLPSPIDIYFGGARLGTGIFSNTFATLKTILMGFLLSCLVGIPLGVAVSVNRLTSEAIYPLIVFLNAFPTVAIAPILVVIFGPDETTRLIIVTLTAFFPIMVATATGIMDTPDEMMDLARVAGASPLRAVITVRLPHAVSFIFGGLRVGVTVAVIGAVVAEFVNANRGLGFLVTSSTAQFAIPTAMACVVMLALISVILYELVNVIHRTFFGWSIRGKSND
ncbi:ABC transporter permease [Ketogulonicigenium vulgare]|uniref:ABC transporter, permease protein n=1 Tax=Ketogulonicigenium vulgare (strain WSH-001) TaxID=759362 RepID=F9Y6F0_KETVW|nr:ABC transporter permease [Ketogulonicigenium vulgare]ADO42701.1 Binding-protein-dependent transport systems inner membrane component [Ketogulonicigenium vulgare Y25]AEM40896.1 ABC transporter, permease protein [Ketogulonicigenium vulgare WSH-001]ALJ81049.1 ABC transporter permease [Ketogulonicigenium vulgare]ANW33803.1 ABC transporter permease [Ketogulonicigenium vulgare]AOZ54612.1 Binding-protein-dependent transporters inner membrane component [Ketogulonicigenium vulgare]